MTSEASRPNPPEVDRVAASRSAISARRARARVKSDVAIGARSAIDVVHAGTAQPRGEEGRLRVTELLRSVPAIGVTKADRIVAELHISPAKRIGGLGRHQVTRLRDFLATWEARTKRRRKFPLFVLAGPTAVGKGAVSTYIRDHYPEIELSISATTRPRRPDEIDGSSYMFVTEKEFDQMVERAELLEWATVHNSHRYGTPRAPVEAARRAGKKILLEIDIQGARTIRRHMPSASLIFLLPPSWDELVRRLAGRGTESAEDQARRLETARDELASVGEFDATVINATVADAAREVVDLVNARGVSPSR